LNYSVNRNIIIKLLNLNIHKLISTLTYINKKHTNDLTALLLFHFLLCFSSWQNRF